MPPRVTRAQSAGLANPPAAATTSATAGRRAKAKRGVGEPKNDSPQDAQDTQDNEDEEVLELLGVTSSPGTALRATQQASGETQEPESSLPTGGAPNRASELLALDDDEEDSSQVPEAELPAPTHHKLRGGRITILPGARPEGRYNTATEGERIDFDSQSPAPPSDAPSKASQEQAAPSKVPLAPGQPAATGSPAAKKPAARKSTQAQVEVNEPQSADDEGTTIVSPKKDVKGKGKAVRAPAAKKKAPPAPVVPELPSSDPEDDEGDTRRPTKKLPQRTSKQPQAPQVDPAALDYDSGEDVDQNPKKVSSSESSDEDTDEESEKAAARAETLAKAHAGRKRRASVLASSDGDSGDESDDPSAGPSTTNPYRQGRNGSKARIPWSDKEEKVFLECLNKYGADWKKINNLHGEFGTESRRLKYRNPVSLKDKARNIKTALIKAGRNVPDCLASISVPRAVQDLADARAAQEARRLKKQQKQT